MKNKLYILSVLVLVTVLLATGCKDKITYTVVFNPNGGSGTMQPQVFAEDEEKNLSSNAFVRENYNLQIQQASAKLNNKVEEDLFRR